MTILVIIITVVYLLGSLLLGLWKLRSNDFESFVSCRDSVGSSVIGLSIAGTAVGGGMFFAVAQAGFEAGIAILALPVSYIVGYTLLIKLLPTIKTRVSESGGHTLYDVLRSRLSDGKLAASYLQTVAAVTFGMYFFLLAGQFTILAGFYRHVFGFSNTESWLASLGVIGSTTLVYSVIGGIKKDLITDVFQVAAVMVGITITGWFLWSAEYTLADTPASHLDMTGYGILFPIAVLLFYSPSFLGRYDYWQRLIAARGPIDGIKGLLISLPLICVAYAVFCWLGVYSRAVNHDIGSADAAIAGLNSLLPEGAYAVVVMSLYAAVMSTADTMLNVSAVSADAFVGRFIKPLEATDQQHLRRIRVLAIGIGTAASVMVVVAADTVDLIVGGFSSLVILTPSIALVVFSRKPAAGVALSSLVSGYVVFLAVFIAVPELRKSAFVAGVLVACVPIISAGMWGLHQRKQT